MRRKHFLKNSLIIMVVLHGAGLVARLGRVRR